MTGTSLGRRSAGALAFAAWMILLSAAPARSSADDGPYVGGDLAWISSERAHLLGSMAAEAPLVQAGAWRVFTVGRATTTIRKASNFTFLLGQVSYSAELGARRRWRSRGTLEVFAEERGRVLVDAAGHARLSMVGGGWESDGFRRAFGPDGWSARATLGVAIGRRDPDAIGSTSGAVRWMRRVGREQSIAVGFEANADALWGHDHGTDVLAGPSVQFDLGDGRRLGLCAKWLSGGNPLGLGVHGALAGFDLVEGPRSGGPRSVPPEIGGFLATGVGDAGRALAGLGVHVASPPFAGGTYAEIAVQAHALTATDHDDLYYEYDVGVGHAVGPWRPGGWFHHRSNHVLDEPNPTVTSLDVLEVGVDSSGWDRMEPGIALGRAGALDLRARLGHLVDSAFGRDVAWNARGAMRWAAPPWGAVRLYLSGELQRGDVRGGVYAVGLLLPHAWDLRVERRQDDQWFSADRRALLGVVTLRL